jgi:phosphoglycerol transferase MdoB-like AlkP superfamily enzyme
MVLKSVFAFLRYFLFWLLFFFMERAVFLIYNAGKIAGNPALEIFKVFGYGLWMDASMAGYFCAIPLLVGLILWFIPKVRLSRMYLLTYTGVLVVCCSVITVINFNIYREWGTKVNFRAFEFAFGSPKEALASTGSSPILLSSLILLALIAAGLFLSRKLIQAPFHKHGNLFLKIPLAFLLLGLNFLAIRGGWQLAPMNESMAYFSTKPILNYAAVNTEWGLATDIKSSKYNTTNPYQYFKAAEAKSIVNNFYQQKSDSTMQVLAEKRPNVVFIIMESFTGNVVSRLGGEPGISNSLDTLMESGIFFDNIYASGGRTDKGVVSVLSGFPAQGSRSIMKENSKQVKIPSVPQTLNSAGYQSTFFYGGESRFFNMKSYLLSHGFGKIIEKEDFNAQDMNSKWGAYDGAVYTRMQAELAKQRQPFFATMLTLTNHEPFELPGKAHFPGDQLENKFRSTAFYADSCLGAFIEQAKRTSWYKHTLFVVVADHGHYLPRTDLEVFDPQRYRIPLLMFGDVIKPEFRGLKVKKIGDQTDIATTVLRQLGQNTMAYTWGKDLFSPASKDFAFFNWDQGFGFVQPGQIITYDAIGKNLLYEREKSRPVLEQQTVDAGKAFMQQVYQEYIEF